MLVRLDSETHHEKRDYSLQAGTDPQPVDALPKPTDVVEAIATGSFSVASGAVEDARRRHLTGIGPYGVSAPFEQLAFSIQRMVPAIDKPYAASVDQLVEIIETTHVHRVTMGLVRDRLNGFTPHRGQNQYFAVMLPN